MYIEFVKFRVRNSSHFSGLVLPFTFQDLASELVKTYKVDNKEVNQALELKLSKSTRVYLMDKVSNSPFTLVCFFSMMQVVIERHSARVPFLESHTGLRWA